MSKKIGFLQRWMFIIDKIYSHPYISIEELKRAIAEELTLYDGVEKIGIAERTIKRDIDEIRKSAYMDISIEYDRVHLGYYIPHDEKSCSKFERLFEVSSLLSFNSLKDIVFIESKQTKGLEHRYSLINAILKSVEVTVEYKKFHSPALEKKQLQPYALKEYRNRWYLLAANVKRAHDKQLTIKSYGLDRIEKLALTSRTFRKNPTFDAREKFRYCFGIFSNEDLPPERVVLSFTPLSGRYAASCPIHETQKTLVDNEEEFRIELTVKITPDFISELLARSIGMRVVEPAGLRKRLVEVHRRAMEGLEGE